MQFSLFGAAAAVPVVDDLDGVLLAGGHWVSGGGRARLSVLVAEPWRAAGLAEAFGALGLAATDTVVDTAVGYSVRTAFSADLVFRAERWARGARVAAPAELSLSAGGLRLWAIATGRRDDAGYLLGTPEVDDPLHRIAGAQLARLGVTAASISARGGPGWRVTSLRRLRRLGELLGPAPRGGEEHWPHPGR